MHNGTSSARAASVWPAVPSTWSSSGFRLAHVPSVIRGAWQKVCAMRGEEGVAITALGMLANAEHIYQKRSAFNIGTNNV